MRNSECELARDRCGWSARVMIAEPEGYDGFVDRAPIRERLHISQIPVCDGVGSHKAAPTLNTG
jgi:hypothetical protein